MNLKLIIILFSLLIYNSNSIRLKSSSHRFKWHQDQENETNNNREKEMGLLWYLTILAKILRENQSNYNFIPNFKTEPSQFKRIHESHGRF
jgi:hypothetical protein